MSVLEFSSTLLAREVGHRSGTAWRINDIPVEHKAWFPRRTNPHWTSVYVKGWILPFVKEGVPWLGISFDFVPSTNPSFLALDRMLEAENLSTAENLEAFSPVKRILLRTNTSETRARFEWLFGAVGYSKFINKMIAGRTLGQRLGYRRRVVGRVYDMTQYTLYVYLGDEPCFTDELTPNYQRSYTEPPAWL